MYLIKSELYIIYLKPKALIGFRLFAFAGYYGNYLLKISMNIMNGNFIEMILLFISASGGVLNWKQKIFLLYMKK